MTKNSKRVEKLMAINPHCHWCGCKVIKLKGLSGQQPDNYATLDHLRHKLDPNRGRDSKESTVLACYRCNQKRNREFFNSLTKEQKTLFSTRIPKIKDLVVTSSNIILYRFK